MYMANLKTELLATQELGSVHLLIATEHWDAIKNLARSRDITASEVVRRLIAAELRKAKT
jgi:hypothetical protein